MRGANVCFDGLNLMIQATFQNAGIYVLLDSGSDSTRFLSKLTRDFPSVLQGAEQTTDKAFTAAGSIERPALILPKVSFRTGGTPFNFENDRLIPNTEFGTFYHVWAGRDMLGNLGAKLDLAAMRFTYK